MNQTDVRTPLAARISSRLSFPNLAIPCCVAAVVLVAIGVLVALPSPFWLDETGTVWAVSGGTEQIPARCATFPLSILYAWLIFGIRAVAGNREWVLRLPSLFAVTLAAVILFRMARRLWGRTAAWLALAMFLSLPSVRFLAGDARPYALGLFFVVVSTWLLLRFVERPSYRLAVLYGIAAGLVPHFHVLFAPALAAHAMYFAYLHFRGFSISRKHLAAGACVIAIVLPLVRPVLALARQPKLHSFIGVPGLESLVLALLPQIVAICLLVGLAVIVASRAPVEWEPKGRSDELILAALLAVTPPLALFAMAVASGTGAFIARYLLPGTVGLSLCFGAFAGGLRPRQVAGLVAMAMVAAHLSAYPDPKFLRHTRKVGNWAAAVAYIDGNTADDGAPVLIRSQYIESDFMPLTPVAGNPAFTQLTCYPSKSHLTGIGTTFGERQMQQIDEFLGNEAKGRRRFLVMAIDSPTSLQPLLAYLSHRQGPGSRSQVLASFDGVQIIEYRSGI